MIARVMRNLGDTNPGVRALFPEDTAHLNRGFFETLGQVVKRFETFQRLEGPLMALGVRAAAAGANPGHYPVIRNQLLATMAELSGDDWTPKLAADWGQVLDAISGAMLRGAHGARVAA